MSMNYNCVCRLCLSSRGELLPIFPTTSSNDTESHALASKIKDCVSVQINENDDLPTNVCRKCMDNVNNWHVFKNVCERTQNKLQSLINKDGSQLDGVKIKCEPLSDEAYDDGVVIDGSYPGLENASISGKVQHEGPPILAIQELTPKSDKGMDSEKDEEELNETPHTFPKVPNMPEVSITVMRPSGETLHALQGIHQLASKDCHKVRQQELILHSLARNTTKITNKRSLIHMQAKLSPNSFNPQARLMPDPISRNMQFMSRNIPTKNVDKFVTPQEPIPIKTAKLQPNSLPYPIRIKALEELQIKKKEPQNFKTFLNSKPEVSVSELAIINCGCDSPETLRPESEIAPFRAEAILSEPDAYDHQHGNMPNNQCQNYDAVDMDSKNENEIVRQEAYDGGGEEQIDGEDVQENKTEGTLSENETYGDHNENTAENRDMEVDDGVDIKAENQGKQDYVKREHENENEMKHENNDDVEDDSEMTPVSELNEVTQVNNSYNSEMKVAIESKGQVKVLDPEKPHVTKAQRDFILKYRDIIQQINTKRCLCCDREHPRRKAVIQHLQKNGHKIPKNTCYNCVVTFGNIGALLSHMWANSCTNLWKIIYDKNGITDDLVLENEPKDNKVQYKEMFDARSYACKLSCKVPTETVYYETRFRLA